MSSIDDFLAKIDPLDLIVFHGDDFVSDTISSLEKYMIGDNAGSVTHVGVAITKELCPRIKGDDGQILIWESILSGPLNDGVYSEETDKSVFGVQVRDLREVVAAAVARQPTSSNVVGVCKLRKNPYLLNGNHKQLVKKLVTAYDNFDGRQFNFDFLDLLASVFPKLRKIRDIEQATVGKLGLDKWLFVPSLPRLYTSI